MDVYIYDVILTLRRLLREVEDEDATVVAADGEQVRELRVEVQGHDARLCVFF